jgi:Secretion system C-terminal sorting domain
LLNIKKVLIIVCLFEWQIFSACYGQNILWESSFSLVNTQFSRDAVQRGDSKMLFLVTDISTSHLGEIWMADTSGNFQWKKQLIIPGLVQTGPNSIKKFREKEEYLVVGTGNDSIGANMTFYAIIDSSGITIMSNLISFPSFQGGSYGFILQDESFFVLGGRFNFDSDLFVIRANTNGIIWNNTFSFLGVESPREIMDLYNGRYLVSAISNSNNFFLEVDLNGNFSNPYYIDSGNVDVLDNYVHPAPVEGYYYSSFVDTSFSFDVTSFFNHIKDSTLLYKFEGDPIRNNFEINSDSNFLFIRNNGIQLGISIARDSILLGTKFFPNDGKSRIIDKISFVSMDQILVSGNCRHLGDFDVWISKIGGIGNEWIPDPCIYSPPQIGFSWDYQFPSLTLTDTSFSGLQYLDTIYNRQWLTSAGDTSSQEQFTTFWDTTGNTTLDVTLIIENWYRCRDTLTTTLSYWINGMEPPPTPSWKAKLYPNPARNQMILNLDGKDLSEKQGFGIIYDIHGRKQSEMVLKSGDQKIDLSKFPPGLYILKIDIDQESRYLRFVKGE